MTTRTTHPNAGPGRSTESLFSSLSVTELVLWYALGAVVVHAVPSMIRLSGAPWTLPTIDQIQAWYWTSAFLLAAFGITLWRVVHGGLSMSRLAGLAAWPWMVGFAALMIRDGIAHSRLVALISGTLGMLLLVVPAAMEPRFARRAPLVAALIAIVAVLAARSGPWADSRAEPHAGAITVVTTAATPIRIHYETGLIPEPRVIGGALARLGRGVLLVTGVGEFYTVGWDSTGQHLRAEPVNLPAPMNRDGVPSDAAHPPLMRVSGLVVDERGDSASVWVAHEVWQPEERCLAQQVSTIRLYRMQAAERAWRRVYRTQPCIKAVDGFDPYDSGGRLTMLGDGSMVLTVGDYGMSNTPGDAVAQKPEGDYGKTILIGADGSRTLYTMGHRNPGGITTDREGNLWVAEHGPRGGDELNLLQRGANYGWPLTTYGTDYGGFQWRFQPPAGSSFSEPALVFVPSIGISNVIAVEGRLFEPWAGDLLVGSLAGRKLLRVHRAGSRVVYAEPIPLNVRVRDLVEIADGRIVIWDDGGDMVWLAPAADVRAEIEAYLPCIGCHDAIEEGDSPFAPPLGGIVDRRVATNPDFGYSDALMGLGGRWTVERLDSFLRSPSEFAPGTRMAFPGIADSVTRKAVIAFLRRSLLVRGH